jgi:hypothetical protein
MAHKVFISYAAEDKPTADAVCQAIEARGVKCWYAPRDVAYGKDFDEVIVDAICESRLMILILSSHSNSSAHVKREVQNACMDDASVPVLPFRVEDVPLNKALRYYIGAVHWLDAVTPPLEGHLNNLVQHVEARLPRTAPLPSLTEVEIHKEPSPIVSTNIDQPGSRETKAGQTSSLKAAIEEEMRSQTQTDLIHESVESPTPAHSSAETGQSPIAQSIASDDRAPENLTKTAPPSVAQPLKRKSPSSSQSPPQSQKMDLKPARRFRETKRPADEPAPPGTEPATKASTLITLLFAFSGAIVFLFTSLLLKRAFSVSAYSYHNPSGVVLRDTIVGALTGITISELFRSPRWSIGKPHGRRAFFVHGAAGALLAIAVLIPLTFFNLMYLDPDPDSWLFGGSKFFTIIFNAYRSPDICFLLAPIGFIVGLVVWGLRLRKKAGQKGIANRRPRLRVVVLCSIAGALILFLLSQRLMRTDHGWLLTIRDTLFGALLGITISELRPSALWFIREGEEVRAFLAHAATGAVIGMVSSGAILSTVGGFYYSYLPFYFNAPLLLALYGVCVGSLIYGVRIIRLKSRQDSKAG